MSGSAPGWGTSPLRVFSLVGKMSRPSKHVIQAEGAPQEGDSVPDRSPGVPVIAGGAEGRELGRKAGSRGRPGGLEGVIRRKLQDEGRASVSTSAGHSGDRRGRGGAGPVGHEAPGRPLVLNLREWGLFEG